MHRRLDCATIPALEHGDNPRAVSLEQTAAERKIRVNAKQLCHQRCLPLVLHNRVSWRWKIDADAEFNTLFARYQRPICAYLTRLTGNVAQAQDLTQEAFFRAYCALLRGEEWMNPRAWLYRTASRLAVDAYRRRRRITWVPISSQDPDPNPGTERTADRTAIQAALAAMPLKYRVPLVLYECEEYAVAEVAEMLGLSISAVKKRLTRARDMFRQAYRPEEAR